MRLSYFFCTSSVGKKQLVAVTGLGMSAFLVSHVLPNMLILFNPEAYNRYSHTLVSNPALPLAEWLLVLALVVHMYFALSLAVKNQGARPEASYSLPKGSVAKRGSFASRSMVYTGLLVLVFLVLAPESPSSTVRTIR
jgi:succinate dehydrogenase / fumarate reductase cytochrome b subunit